MDFDFDRPPEGWTLVWMGLGVFVLLGACCCISAPIGYFLAGLEPGRAKR